MGLLKQKVSRITLLFGFVFLVLLCTGVSTYGAEPVATGIVGEGGVNVRSSYSTSSNIVTTLGEGTSVTVVMEKYTSANSSDETTRWYSIKKSGIQGWVRADCISVSYTPVTATVTGNINVRTGPGTGFTSEGKIEKGTTVSVRLKAETSSGAAWYQIVYNGNGKFVSGSYVSFPEENTTVNTNFSNELAAFPSSYHAALTALHQKYPAWHFKAKSMNYTWDAALDEQMYNVKMNTIPSSKPDGWKMVADGTYNFDTKKYIGLDGSSWVAASKKTVAFYMDPRNWLDEINIFMFESLIYDPASQSEAMVKSLLSQTAIKPSFSSSYMLAGETFDISPVYLAAKSRLELGTSDYMVSGTKFTYNGKTYQGFYNAYNIGASDSSSGDAAKKGLVYAAGSGSYLRPWKTLDLAIRGGAQFIAEDFIGNNQHTLYYERFNVANGLSAIGTHQYMTNTMAAATQANITYWEYEENDMLETAFTFEIPVYQNMPSTKAAEPKSGSNNYYLDSLKVYEGSSKKAFTATFNRFKNTYTLKSTVPYDVDTLTVNAVANAADAQITITGNTGLQIGSNQIKVKVKAASGLYKYYYINLTKEAAKKVVAPDVKISNEPSSGKIQLSWASAPNADTYQIFRSTSKSGTYTHLQTVTASPYIDTTAVAGTTYYYQVKSVGTEGIIGEANSAIVYRACDLPRPVVKAVNVASTGKIKLSWQKIDGAKGYEIYRATSKNGTYQKLSTITRTSVTNTKVTVGKTYYYKVKALSNVKSSANSAYSEIVLRTCDLPRPVVKAVNVASTGKIKLRWNAIEGAKGYEIYRATSKNGTYKKLSTVTGTSVTNTKATAGKTYYYKVRAISKLKNAANSADSAYVSRTCDLPRPVVTIKLSKGKPRLSWRKIEGAKAYEIYRATSKNGTYKKLATTTKTYATNTKVTSGKTYYYRVRALSEVRNAANSAYSLKQSKTAR